MVPVDTHVYQIATKYYGLKGSSGKVNMTAKLYEDINTKLASIWGDYAGWAHTVRPPFVLPFVIPSTSSLDTAQVLFTADLKSFSSYGLPSPSPTPVPTPSKKAKPVLDPSVALPTPPLTPSLGSRKRKQEFRHSSLEEPTSQAKTVVQVSQVSMADRVKRRRRS